MHPFSRMEPVIDVHKVVTDYAQGVLAVSQIYVAPRMKKPEIIMMTVIETVMVPVSQPEPSTQTVTIRVAKPAASQQMQLSQLFGESILHDLEQDVPADLGDIVSTQPTSLTSSPSIMQSLRKAGIKKANISVVEIGWKVGHT